MIATNMLTESALRSCRSESSPRRELGTIISDGQGLLYTSPGVAIAPGLAIVLTVLCHHRFLVDGVRDALDPRARLGSGAGDRVRHLAG